MLAPSWNTIVVIPTYNERPNLSAIVNRVLQETPFSLVIVDDASPDGTGELADQLASTFPDRVSVVHRAPPRGLGRSYIDGMRHALALGAERVCQMDADLSHGPEYLTDLVAATADADVVVGSRYVRGISVAYWPLRRLLLSLVANAYVRLITGIRVRDATSGFKCWRREALAAVLNENLRSDGYALQFEMLFLARRHGCDIVEVPFIFVERRDGASKMSTRVMIEAFVRPLQLVWRRGAKPNQAALDRPARRPV